MKFLIDMCLRPSWRDFLERAGYEALHWSEVGSDRAADPVIMAYAEREGYIVLTQDLDFGSELAAGRRASPSVVQLRADDVRPSRMGLQVLEAIRTAGEELKAGALVTVDPKRVRVRPLPFEVNG